MHTYGRLWARPDTSRTHIRCLWLDANLDHIHLVEVAHLILLLWWSTGRVGMRGAGRGTDERWDRSTWKSNAVIEQTTTLWSIVIVVNSSHFGKVLTTTWHDVPEEGYIVFKFLTYRTHWFTIITASTVQIASCSCHLWPISQRYQW